MDEGLVALMVGWLLGWLVACLAAWLLGWLVIYGYQIGACSCTDCTQAINKQEN